MKLFHVNLTDNCDANCPWCYNEHSGKNGKHALLYKVKNFLNEIKDSNAIIYLDGGEPTNHPQLLDILRMANKNKIIVNMFSSNMTWLRMNKLNIKNESLINFYILPFGKISERFGFITNNHEDLINCIFNRILYNYVIGMDDKKDFHYLLKYIYRNSEFGKHILFSNYETTGNRSKSFEKYNCWNLFEEANNLEIINCLNNCIIDANIIRNTNFSKYHTHSENFKSNNPDNRDCIFVDLVRDIKREYVT